jgi:hypothetical protein
MTETKRKAREVACDIDSIVTKLAYAIDARAEVVCDTWDLPFMRMRPAASAIEIQLLGEE